VTLEVTAYSWGCGATGYTSSGQWPFVGGAAADTAQFPYGSHLYIPNWGTVVVNDTGGAIGWGHIDLMAASCGQAIAWGVRSVTATVYR
jgi:3D (Asp-Asp-Asp) domain-containing protein